MNVKNTKKVAIKKDTTINIVTTDGKTLAGKVKNFSRHPLGGVYIELEQEVK